jgi:hypothetical protein
MFHVDGNPFAATVALQVGGYLKSLAALWATHGAAGFNGNHLCAMFSEEAAQGRSDNAGWKTDDSDARKRSAIVFR